MKSSGNKTVKSQTTPTPIKRASVSASTQKKSAPTKVPISAKVMTPAKKIVAPVKKIATPEPSSDEEELNEDINMEEDEDMEEDDDEVEVEEVEQKIVQKTKSAEVSVKAPVTTNETSTVVATTSRPNAINTVEEDEQEDNRSFEDLGLCSVLCESVAALGWKKPSIIQLQTLPIAFTGRDIIGLAETGSGKTGAFALPILQALLARPQTLFGLVLAPTRELAFQIAEQFEALGAPINLRCVTIVGGVDEMEQARALARLPHIVVATPGRIVYHLENTKGFNLRNLRYFVLDEADRLLNMDFEKEINKILEVLPRDRRSFLFSATMTSKVAKLQRASLIDPVKIEVSKKYQTARNLVQQYVFCPAKHKETYLTYILNELAGNTAIIFTSTCEQTQRLAIMLRTLGFSAIPLHGKLSQASRLGALNKFKAGQRSILIATDVASRGLDIPAVDLVINFDVPSHSKDYIHRVGRTARAGRSGRAITVVTQYDVELYQRIENLLGKKLDEYPAQKESVLVLMERVSEALRFSAIELREQDEDGGLHGKRKGGPGGKGGHGGHGGKKPRR